MCRATAKFALALSAAGLFALTAAAGPTVPHKETFKGTIDSLAVDPVALTATQTWSGSGNATHMGNYTESGSHTLDLLTGELEGEFFSVAADGSTISGSYAGSVTEVEPGVFQFDVIASYETGTGRLAGVTGEARVIAYSIGAGPGSETGFVGDGYWTFP